MSEQGVHEFQTAIKMLLKLRHCHHVSFDWIFFSSTNIRRKSSLLYAYFLVVLKLNFIP